MERAELFSPDTLVTDLLLSVNWALRSQTHVTSILLQSIGPLHIDFDQDWNYSLSEGCQVPRFQGARAAHTLRTLPSMRPETSKTDNQVPICEKYSCKVADYERHSFNSSCRR